MWYSVCLYSLFSSVFIYRLVCFTFLKQIIFRIPKAYYLLPARRVFQGISDDSMSLRSCLLVVIFPHVCGMIVNTEMNWTERMGPLWLQGEPVYYHLYGVLIHQGGHCHMGHYYCYVKAPSNVWYVMNDSMVSGSISLGVGDIRKDAGVEFKGYGARFKRRGLAFPEFDGSQ